MVVRLKKKAYTYLACFSFFVAKSRKKRDRTQHTLSNITIQIHSSEWACPLLTSAAGTNPGSFDYRPTWNTYYYWNSVARVKLIRAVAPWSWLLWILFQRSRFSRRYVRVLLTQKESEAWMWPRSERVQCYRCFGIILYGSEYLLHRNPGWSLPLFQLCSLNVMNSHYQARLYPLTCLKRTALTRISRNSFMRRVHQSGFVTFYDCPLDLVSKYVIIKIC